MWSILENVPCALEKKVYSSAFGCYVLKISMISVSSKVSFKVCVSLLIFCFDDLSVGVSGLCYCQFLLLCLLVFVLCTEVLLCWVHQFSSVAQSCPTLRLRESQHTRPPCPSPTPGVDGPGSQACCSPWGHKELDTTE